MDDFFAENYRQDYFERIVKLLSRGESILLFGPSGIGKTSDLHFLFYNKTAQKRFFPKGDISFLWINAEEMTLDNLLEYTHKTAALSSVGTNQIVVIIDQIEKLNNPEFKPLLIAIKSLRESTRPKTSVIFLSEIDLSKQTRPGTLEILQPLILENPINISPLSQKDALSAIDFWCSYYQTTITKGGAEKLLKLAGNFPRIIKRLIKLHADKVPLGGILKNPSLDPKLKLDLEKTIAFNRANPQYTYHFPLLDILESSLVEDADQVGSICFCSKLSRQEYNLANLLISKLNEFVSREEMIEAIWKNKQYDVNEHALDQMLHRLRSKLYRATPKCNLITYRGRGCKLESA